MSSDFKDHLILVLFLNLGFGERSFIIFGLYEYFGIRWIWFCFLPPSVHIGYVQFIYHD